MCLYRTVNNFISIDIFLVADNDMTCFTINIKKVCINENEKFEKKILKTQSIRFLYFVAL